ncbi:MAG TPA: DUF362 domain-containing protein [Terriglobia bacterium]|nr:DUF362 domain-containing protein [Terriglobia bacterium]
MPLENSELKPIFCGSNRREFLRTCIAGAALGVAPVPHAGSAPAALQTKSRVVVARDAALRGSGASVDSARLLKLLDRAMQSFYDCDSPLAAWKKLVRPGEVVGLKVNCLAGRGTASTNVMLVEAIAERLQQAGIKDIVVWDRLDGDLESAGFRPGSKQSGIRYIGNDSAGYEQDLAIYGSVGSLVSRTLTRTCDAVINLPVLKDHGIAGITLALKNLFGAIHNPNKYHLDVGDPYIADVNMLPPIRQKIRLSICDATTAQYEGGPSYMPQWSWPFNGLLVAQDPVALDYTGWRLIEQKRSEQGMKSLEAEKRAPTYIATAADARHRLGTNQPSQIEKVEV